MRRLIKSLLIVFPFVLTQTLWAESAPTPPTAELCSPTELIVSTAFDEPTPKIRKGKISGWSAAIGEWRIENGVLHGDEVAEDNHPSSCTYKSEFQDVVITAQFKLGTAKEIAFGIRDSIEPHHHLGRTFITPTSVYVQHMSGIAKTTKSTKLKTIEASIDKNQWYSLKIEVCGDKYHVRVGEYEITVQHERFKDAKALVALISKGDGAQFKNVSIWRAEPNPKNSKNRP
jgi:hypothetical protein